MSKKILKKKIVLLPGGDNGPAMMFGRAWQTLCESNTLI